MKKTLNPRLIAALKSAPAGTKYDVADAVVPGFAVRVTDKGAKSYVLIKRMPGASHPTRRTIARVGAVELSAARETARNWLEQITAGVDPKAAGASESKTEPFELAAETYIAQRLGAQKKKDEIARAIRREFGGVVDGKPCGPWQGKPIAKITQRDIADIVTKKAETAPTQARNILHYVSRLFSWAKSTGKIELNPCLEIKPHDIFDKIVRSGRILSDDELRKVWLGSFELKSPWSEIYRLLILTGCRVNEVADGGRSEIDVRTKAWEIPGGRMKGKLPHVIPLTPMMLEVLNKLPLWNGGDFLFSNTNGEKSVFVSDFVKRQMDKAAKVYGWVNHDLRRTMRSHLSKLPIEEHVRELMIAHKRKGVEAVYDKYEYLAEKRAGFEAWNARLQSILEPAANVMTLKRAG